MPSTDAVGAIAALHDPLRRSLFELVAASPVAMSRDAAADALSIPRSTAAFHLDRLAQAGLLVVEHRRLTGRTGPGSGRPSKLYRATEAEVVASVPDRRYDLMGELLAAGVEVSARSGEPVLDAVRSSARAAGRRAGPAGLDQVLEEGGYGATMADGDLVLANCPFHRLAAAHTDVVCGANLAFLRGAAEASGIDGERVVLDPGPGRCCVRIIAARG